MEPTIRPLSAEYEKLAAQAYALSWQSAHAGLVSEAFLQGHTPERMLRTLHGELAKPGASGYVCLMGAKAAGILVIDRRSGEIVKLYVAPAWQGKGVGTALLRFGLAQLRDHPGVFLHVLNVNAGARAFYERHGFYPSGEENVLNAARGLSELTYVCGR